MTPDEKQQAIREMNREHLELGREQQRVALEYIDKLRSQGKFSSRCERQLARVLDKNR